MAVHVGSTAEWRTLLQSTIVVADCMHSSAAPPIVSPPPRGQSLTSCLTVYADWCGPCKMIAPTFESLATKYTKPKRIAFAKIDVDKLRDVASQYGVRAMPTFMIFKNGSPIETIQGANPPKLTQAVENAVKMAGPVATAGFSAPGRTLGGPGAAGSQRQSLRRPIKWDLNNFVNAIIGFFGLYFVSLFSVGCWIWSLPFGRTRCS